MSLSLATRLLQLSALGTIIFGLALMLSPHSGLALVGRLFLDLGYWPVDGQQSITADSTRLLLAISGLGAVIWQVSTYVMPTDLPLARRLLLPALLGWYLPDSLGSILSGAAFNAVMNTGFLLMFLLPLMMARPDPQPRHGLA
ncbi:excinuclease ABC subunit A [Phaeobacter sp. HF9A]|uniref:excinuclease ABC subunit A n=1 Tax=Phaeobacter sp. HF9A TaxID=2721561 RepID=UPI001431AE9B|nr:excinuclease ABC subunit A [Phaeobacter sp. HF9A]NIZ13529.1 excinuclease ABC subunit A [Phaeobacter sp. HF9A]